MQTLPVSTVKAKLNEYAREVATHHERIALTRNGVADAVLMSLSDLETLEETIAVLSDPTAMAALAEAHQEHRDGVEPTPAQAMGELIRRRRATG